jgi:hypothetical protein
LFDRNSLCPPKFVNDCSYFLALLTALLTAMLTRLALARGSAQLHYVCGTAWPSTGVTATLRAVWQKSIGLRTNSNEYKADDRAGRRKSINVAIHVAGPLGGETLSLA